MSEALSNIIWVEKYRPNNLSDVIGQDAIISRLKSYVQTRNLPHLLFSGSPGVGKTAAAIALVKELFGDGWKENFLELNASDERGIDVVRVKIKEFARVSPINSDFKVIFLDEADALTNDAQSALRRTMEKYSASTRFILSCNYSSKIIEPIQSRCAIYRFKPVESAALQERIKYIAGIEGLSLDQGALDAIFYVSNGDMRRAISALQSASFNENKVITSETIFQVSSNASPSEINQMIKTALLGDFDGARNILDDLLFTQGLAGSDVIFQVYKAVIDLKVSSQQRASLVEFVGETDYRMTVGSNERIQIETLLAHFAKGS